MLNFFLMIFRGFIFVANFGTRMFGWFSSLARYAMYKTVIRIFLFSLFYAFLLMLIGFTAFFFYYMISNIIVVYNLISAFLNFISNSASGGGDVTSTLFFFLALSGISAGVQSFFPFIASALLFLLVKALYRITLFFYRQVLQVADTILKVV